MSGSEHSGGPAGEAPAFAIRLKGLQKHYVGSAEPAVTNLDLDIPAGQIMVFVGPSGCGKTTTLKMINRLIEPTAGSIEVFGQDVTRLPKPQLRRQIGYVIQQIGLFPHLSIEANIGTVPRLLRWKKADIRSRVEELAELVGLEPEMLKRYPAELSGGQQQRVGVARALAADPPILLMDEPYSAVDPLVRSRLQQDLLELQANVQKTIVIVTHDVDEAILLGDQMVIFERGGHIAQGGTPTDVLAAPASPFVESFLGKERGLKRLSLMNVSDIELNVAWSVEATTSAEEARGVMATQLLDWIGVTKGDQLEGWVWGKDLTDDATVGDAPLHEFWAQVTPDTTLRETLDGIINSRTRVAVVCDHDGRYLGMITVAAISEGINGA